MSGMTSVLKNQHLQGNSKLFGMKTWAGPIEIVKGAWGCNGRNFLSSVTHLTLSEYMEDR